ncbi:hypothetical protein [Phocaeicola vulgatus]|uniref:hypothetical protein n=1 Tax=Phocaeicola vulgatus TaxID=821 RepID=UPI00356A873D
MKKVVFMLFALCHAVFSFAQHTHLTLEESKEIKEIAMKKVESFQADCKKIADSNIPFHKKTSKDGYIDVTMLDFMEDASIRVTSPDGKNFTGKPVKHYLKRLALSNRIYKMEDFTLSNVTFSADFAPDPLRGKNWYVGELCYNRILKANHQDTGRKEHLNEKMAVRVRIHAHRKSIVSDGKEGKFWEVKLGNITAKNLE